MKTVGSAALVGSSCGSAGFDGDRDGLSDLAEIALTRDIAAVVDEVVLVRRVTESDGVLSVEKAQSANFEHLYGLELDFDEPFSMDDASGHPVADIDTVDAFVRDLNTAHLNLRVQTERNDRFLAIAGRDDPGGHVHQRGRRATGIYFDIRDVGGREGGQ